MNKRIYCICIKCGVRGYQKPFIKEGKNYINIVHKDKECELGKVMTTQEFLKSLSFI